jgi:hypothetical protein
MTNKRIVTTLSNHWGYSLSVNNDGYLSHKNTYKFISGW